jgi:serine/threonine-protein kinase
MSSVERVRAALAGRYEVERELREGEAVAAYLARDLVRGGAAELRVLRRPLTDSSGAERFVRGTEVLSRLRHARIVPVYEWGVVEGLAYAASPRVGGETLRERLQREGRLPAPAAVALAAEVADALAYAHAQSVLHDDLRPEHIVLKDGHAALTGFRMAYAEEGEPPAASDDAAEAAGAADAAAYASPERLAGEPAREGRSDVYSLGCVLYEAIGGRPPFADPDAAARRLEGPPPALHAQQEDVHPAVDALLAQLLAPAPADRLGSAQELGRALGELAATLRRGSKPSGSGTAATGLLRKLTWWPFGVLLATALAARP